MESNRRRPVTYALFAGAAALAVIALAGLPRRTRALPPPPPPRTLTPPPVLADPPPPPPPQQAERPRVEVVFALDTTGSMSGLIEGAKRKIWSIADFLASGQPRPEIRIGLVGYRDIGDDYVTRFYDLSDDLDTVFAHLQSFSADGGGDTPEHVGRALHDAVERASWSSGDKVVRLIYLVGDAPPHTDYQDGYDYRAMARKAAKKGIHINTVRCGDDPDTRVAWREIARVGQGDYASIEQSGGMAVVTTPYDDRLAELNRKLASTALGWGAHKREVAAKASAAAAAPAAIAADRVSFAAKKGLAVSGDGELVNDIAAGKAKLADIKAEELPAELQGLPAPAQEAYIEKKQIERQRLIEEINRVSNERADFLKKDAAKSPKPKAAFDDEVRRSVTKAAAGAIAY
ncbi:MAG TPA: vWA domain-containing protein [Polyangia bacterium]|jgi:Mg-chelatase subunit ChlD|nr:vWA domain-containing protein [Polyangia bacterium]